MHNDSHRVNKAAQDHRTRQCWYNLQNIRPYTFLETNVPTNITLNMPLDRQSSAKCLRTTTIMGCLVVALMNPRIGTVFETLFDRQCGMVGAQILRVGLRVERTGPNHDAASHGLDRYVQRWKSSAAPRFNGIQIEKNGENADTFGAIQLIVNPIVMLLLQPETRLLEAATLS
jgi:hypothetical protein